MKRSVRMLLVIAALSLFANLVLASQDAQPISGTWTFQIELPSGNVSAQATLTQEEAMLKGTMTSPDGPLSVEGSADATWVRIYAAKADSSTILVFEGLRGDGAMSGTVVLRGEVIGKWSAKRG